MKREIYNPPRCWRDYQVSLFPLRPSYNRESFVKENQSRGCCGDGMYVTKRSGDFGRKTNDERVDQREYRGTEE